MKVIHTTLPYPARILRNGLKRSLCVISIAVLSLLTLSLKTEDRKIDSIHKYVFDVITKDNEFLLQHYFLPIHEKELEQGTLHFFDGVRYEYQKVHPVDLQVLQLEKETYRIEIGECSYPLLVYPNRRKLTIRSVMPFMKGDVIVGFVPANLKFKED